MRLCQHAVIIKFRPKIVWVTVAFRKVKCALCVDGFSVTEQLTAESWGFA